MNFSNKEEMEVYIKKEGTAEIWQELDRIVEDFWTNDKKIVKEGHVEFVKAVNRIFPGYLDKSYSILLKYIKGEKLEIENELKTKKD